MGAFNTVRVNARCTNCGDTVDQDVQFKFGDCWLHKYTVGDRLDWGGNDRGKPGLVKVLVPGMSEPCSSCAFLGNEFIVTIEHDVITAVEPLPEDSAWMSRFLYLVEDEEIPPPRSGAERDPRRGGTGPAQ